MKTLIVDAKWPAPSSGKWELGGTIAAADSTIAVSTGNVGGPAAKAPTHFNSAELAHVYEQIKPRLTDYRG